MQSSWLWQTRRATQGQPSQQCACDASETRPFTGGHKKDDPLCVFHRQGDLNGGQAPAFLRQQRAARGEGRLWQPPGDETQTERRPPTSYTGKQPRPTAASHKPVKDRPQSAEPSRDVRLPRALLPSNRDLLQTLTSQRGTTSQGRLDRPPKQPEQSPHRGRQLPGTRLPVLQRCGENVEAAEIKTLSEDSKGKHKKCVSANLVRVGQGGIFPLLLRLFWARKCTLHPLVYYSSYIGGCLDVTPLSFRSFRSVPSGIVERRPLLLRSLRLIWGPRQTTPPASHRGS